MPTTASESNSPERLLAKIDALDPAYQVLLELLAVFYEPVHRANLLAALKASGQPRAGGKAHTYESLRMMLGEIAARGWVSDSSSGVRCDPSMAELLVRHAIAAGRFVSHVNLIKATDPSHYISVSHDRLMRDFRIAVYSRKWDDARHKLEQLANDPYRYDSMPPLARVFGTFFDPALIAEMPEDIKCSTLMQVMDDSVRRLTPQPGALEMLETYCRAKKGEYIEFMRFVLVQQYLLRGRWTDARVLAADRNSSGCLTIHAWLAFMQGRNNDAITLYEDALSIIRKGSGRRKAVFPDLFGHFYPLALLRSDDLANRDKASVYLKPMIKNRVDDPYASLTRLSNLLLLDLDSRRPFKKIFLQEAEQAMYHSAIEALLGQLVLCWCGIRSDQSMQDRLRQYALQAHAAGYAWLARESAAVINFRDPQALPIELADFRDMAPECAGPSLVDLFKREEAWERALAAMGALVAAEPAPAAEPDKPAGQPRLTWRVQVYNQWVRIDPCEQRPTARGGWTSGRPVALKRLASEHDKMPWLTAQDRKVCAAIKAKSYSHYHGYHSVDYDLEPASALPLLVGHPLVFWADEPDTPIEVVLGQPELHVEQQSDRICVSLKPPVDEQAKIGVLKESLNRLRVVPLAPEHRRLAQILGKGLSIPDSARERVLATMAKVAPLVSVHSQIGTVGEALEQIAADPTPHLLLMPAGAGFQAEIIVRPLGETGPALIAGRGAETLITEVAGRRVQAARDLDRERSLAESIEATLAPLGEIDDAERRIWSVPDPEKCLELLAALREMPDQGAVVEWPKGGRLSVSRPATPAALNLAIKHDHDWFSLSGKLCADENLAIEMQRLIELLDTTPGRFIPLGEGQYLALTRELRRRLDELRALSETHGKGLRVHAAAAPALAELAEETGALKTDKAWRDLLGRIREAQSLEPRVPSTLKAELRDYQRDGFAWMARLAHWGAGACLADDMGLGKTVQALAILLDRAKDGPALIVAPTSVCLNWTAEASRFAPTLKVHAFGPGNDRRATVEGLGPFDLLVTSYDLMHREEKLLASRSWRTIVLDEAQAIKNMATRRSRAAMKIGGDFRIITTGTPIENHLGELWNLFRFLNPGLLGSLERFNQRFAEPIERHQDRSARSHLKKLLQPFILRRMRAQVLDELPPRTEILMEIESGPGEASFYDALRHNALDRLQNGNGTAARQRFQILAEIMRLRRACCNPRLISPEISVPSAKLDAFGELVDKLLDGGHKALVFSQFTDHLALIRDYLDQRRVCYQYLDGTMTAEARQRAATEFQNGRGDLFLISLKAGGTGLNLTAADYVIHLDPWWNPAVEDQATGRAHRIGQEQPVTVYRLVLSGTIEQKIMDLHRHKRDLADSLLEGTDSAGRLSAEDLLNLLREN